MNTSEKDRRQEAFEETQAKGYKAIQHSTQKKTLLHMWVRSDYGNATAWTIFYRTHSQLQQVEQPYVQTVHWDRMYDFQRFFTVEVVESWSTNPKLITRETGLDADQLQVWLDRGRNIQIPVIGISFPGGRDGGTFGLEISSGLNLWGGLQLSWWQEGPEPWQPLNQWCNGMVDFLVQCLDEADSK